MINRSMESYVITMLHIANALIPSPWMFGVVHEEYVHYHPDEYLCLAIIMGMECNQLGEVRVQYFPKCYAKFTICDKSIFHRPSGLV